MRVTSATTSAGPNTELCHTLMNTPACCDMHTLGAMHVCEQMIRTEGSEGGTGETAHALGQQHKSNCPRFRVAKAQKWNGEIGTGEQLPGPLGNARLRECFTSRRPSRPQKNSANACFTEAFLARSYELPRLPQRHLPPNQFLVRHVQGHHAVCLKRKFILSE